MSYVTVDEFLARMGVTAPTAEDLVRGQDAVDAATQEIDAYLSW